MQPNQSAKHYAFFCNEVAFISDRNCTWLQNYLIYFVFAQKLLDAINMFLASMRQFYKLKSYESHFWVLHVPSCCDIPNVVVERLNLLERFQESLTKNIDP